MSTQLKVSIGQHSDKGLKPENQDFLAFKIPSGSSLDIKGVVLAMADGISSSDVSGIASETSVKSFIDDYYCTSDAWSVNSSVERVLTATNSWLYSHTMNSQGRFDKDKGYVCTFSCMVIKNNKAHISHVGDTRVYQLSENGLEQLTKDHRLWVEQDKSYLSRALGMAQQCEFEQQSLQLAGGELFIIATDGIYEFISAQEMIALIHAHKKDLNKAANLIVEQALNQGSDDNLSIQIVAIDDIVEQGVSPAAQLISQASLPPILEAGAEFDGYQIIRPLYSSARSHLYLAQQSGSDQHVVLKMPSINLGCDPAYLESFVMEEWVSRRLHNPYLLKAEAVASERHYIYTIFEYIEGQTLAQWASDNPKPSLEKVRSIIEQIAKGLQAMHRMEMLHQDLRPENIMIDGHGSVKIIDFGAVSIAGIQETLSHEPLTYLQGTALYSAPEYFLGLPGCRSNFHWPLSAISC